MRLTTAVTLLPVLAVAQQSPLDQIRAAAQPYIHHAQPIIDLAQPYLDIAQPYLAKAQSYIPNPHRFDPVAAAAAKAAGVNIDYLSNSNWEETLRPAGKSYAKESEEWWVLVTGGNKTCFGLCDTIEKSYNETAALFAVDPSAPHLATLNCDHSPILCAAWSAGPPYVWIFDIGAPETKTDLYKIRLNTTTTTPQTFTDLRSTQSWKKETPYEGYFHPFDGQIKQAGLSTTWGYITWVFSIVPSWLMMISISFLSRTFMGRATNRAGARPGGAPAAPVAPPANTR